MVQRPISHAYSYRHVDFNDVFGILKGTSEKIYESSNPKYSSYNKILHQISIGYVAEPKMKWAASWQNQQRGCAPSEDSAWASAQSDQSLRCALNG